MAANKKTLANAEDPKQIADYDVLSPLKHSGTLYDVGDTVALSESEAAPLLVLAVVKAAAIPVKAGEQTKNNPEGGEQ